MHKDWPETITAGGHTAIRERVTTERNSLGQRELVVRYRTDGKLGEVRFWPVPKRRQLPSVIAAFVKQLEQEMDG